MLVVACANVYSGCIAMARRDAVFQSYQFDPESDPEGGAPDCMCCHSYNHVANASSC